MNLGLPELDRNGTRQALSEYFELYREYKQILAMGGYEPSMTAPASAGLEQPGADPDTIRAQYKFSSSTESSVLINERMQKFVDRMDKALLHMFKDRAEIIKRKYLCYTDRLPSDEDVWESLKTDGFAMSFRLYQDKKAKALWTLAFALGAEHYAEKL